MRFIAIFAVLFTLQAQSAQERNYFDKETKCLLTKDIREISGHFRQFAKFANNGKKEICQGEMTEEWTNIVRSILALKRINVAAVERDQADDFTRRGMPEKDWWAYFKKRANYFVQDNNCRENVIAYVYPSRRGTIYLCKPFYAGGLSSQLGTMMHEVRHFDGHRHVTCTRGNEKGKAGACDNLISRGGSYAISAQTSVEMSFVKQFSAAERASSEASAIYTMFNKFNQVPVVKAENTIYLGNDKGEVYKWHTDGDKKGDLDLVAEMSAPARLYSNGAALTIFPMDVNQDAFRVARAFDAELPQIGAFANKYNELSASARKQFVTANYFGTGAIVLGSTLHSFCGNGPGLAKKSFTTEKIKALVNLNQGEDDVSVNIVGESGQLYKFECVNDRSLKISRTNLKFPTNLKESFDVEGVQYGLSKSGDIVQLVKSGVGFDAVPLMTGQNWVSATPLRNFPVFAKDQDGIPSFNLD